jgi:hypothetical protein
MNASATPRPTAAQVLLGLFVLWQLFFLPASNLTGLLLWAPPELAGEQPALEAVAAVTDRWGQTTGQVQNWRLFAPNVPAHAVFIAVELRWNEGAPLPAGVPRVVRLPSFYEPPDPSHYFHPPGSSDRLFHYENVLGSALYAWDREAVSRRPVEWRQYLANNVRRQWPAQRAYLRWRLARFQCDHPGLPPPDEAILLTRLHPTSPPGRPFGSRPAVVEVPVARWSPRQPESDERRRSRRSITSTSRSRPC